MMPSFVSSNIEKGSPAAATGKLKVGQIIEAINGQKLADIDPRIQLARILGKAEASDGAIQFAIKGQAEAVTVQVPVLGAYSKTWPLDCPKSEKIVRQVADRHGGRAWVQTREGGGAEFVITFGSRRKS